MQNGPSLQLVESFSVTSLTSGLMRFLNGCIAGCSLSTLSKTCRGGNYDKSDCRDCSNTTGTLSRRARGRAASSPSGVHAACGRRDYIELSIYARVQPDRDSAARWLYQSQYCRKH